MCGSIPARDHLNGTPHMKALQDSSHTSFVDDGDSSYNISSNGFDNVLCPAPSTAGLCVSSTVEQGSSILSLRSFDRDTDTVESALKCGIVTKATVSCQKVFTCTVCDITCSGIIPMKQHLYGESHHKKLSRMNTVVNSTSQLTRSLEAHTFSSPCDTSLTVLSAVPRSKESSSASTKNGIVQAAVKDGTIIHAKGAASGSLTCRICHIRCSGEISMNQHLRGNFHRKMSAMEAPVSSAPQVPRPLKSKSASTHCNTSLESHMPLSIETDVSSDKDFVQTAVVDSAVSPGEVADICGPDCEVCQQCCNGAALVKEGHLGNLQEKKRSKMDSVESSTTQMTRPVGAHSFSFHCNSSQTLVPAVSSSIELHHSLSIEDDDRPSPDKDLVHSPALDSSVTSGEGDDSSNLSYEASQMKCFEVTPLKQILEGSLNHMNMSPGSTLTPWQSSSAHLENKSDRSITPSKGKAAKKHSQQISKNWMINNEPGQCEGEPCGVSIQQGTKTNLTTLQHYKDLPEEMEIIVSALGNLKEIVNDLNEKFTSYEVMIKKHDERLSSIEFNNSQIFARQDSETGQLAEKCAIQDRKIAALEEQINSQNSTINQLKNLSTIKDNKITDLLKQMKQLIDQHITSKGEVDKQNCSHAC
ncbi:uncharacterized protein [Panulirus ornatus]|uniref:uncharacterized protein n=1 Tax=Panulirus ornatus TaxID=150431 RepID=UPI003A853547